MIYDFLGVTPVRPDAPPGSDVRSDPDYDALNVEIEKMANPSAGMGTDWQRVADLSSGLLTNKGKDLQVACYLGVALVQIQQIRGCAIALQILGDLIENYWDTMFPAPTRIRGRRNAVEWWLERTLALLSAVTIAPFEPDELAALKGRFKRFDDLLRDKDPEGPLLNRLGSLINGIPIKETAKPASEASAAPAAQNELSGTLENPEKALEAALSRIAQIAGNLRDSDITNVLSYRLARIASWTQLEQIPPMNDGRTSVPPPPGQDMETLKSLRAGSEPDAAISFAEARLSEYPFWMDLNRASSEGLARLGEGAAAADAAIKLETAHLLRRLPKLERGAFADGTPFSDAGTLAWIASFGNAGQNESDPQPGQDPSVAKSSAAVFEEAQKLANQGKFMEAVEALDALCRGTASERLRMLTRMRVGELILANNSNGELRPYFAPLLETIDRYRLESWEPALAIQALILIYQGLGAETEAGCGLPPRTDILKRIALIDFGQALRLATP